MSRTILILFLLAMSAALTSQSYIMSNKIPLNWQLEYTLPGKPKPKTTPAIVPGAVQLDIARTEQYGTYYFAENWKDYLWMEDSWFTYRTTFSKPEVDSLEKVFFISMGIDYEFDITLNGKKIFYQQGMFTPVKLDLTDILLKTNVLEIRIFPVPKAHREPADRSQASQSVKPAVSYKWDWHPRLIPSGIWDETWLEVRPASRIDHSRVQYQLNETLTKAAIQVEIEGSGLIGTEVIWKLRDAGDQVIASKVVRPRENNFRIDAYLEKLNLWWPHDHGTPYIYTSVIEIRDRENQLVQAVNETLGFRQVRLVMNEGAWAEPTGFPKSRSVAPAQLEINGRKIFAKGTNWVNPEIFPGMISAARYNELTDRAVEANFNILRVWGGGIINKDAFYDQCDQKGILVWQEFPLSCNNYKDNPEYLAVLGQEAESIILRLRNHPCIAIWSGGNELFNSWSGMTDQSKALRLLNSKCYELDPNTPYINTSPLEGMGHGHYVFRDMDTGEEVYSTMAGAKFTAYTEFGVPSPSPVSVLKKIIPERELWPPARGTSWESHHAFGAWVGDTWLMQDMIEEYFGPSKNLQELVINGQMLQVEGYKAIYEEARRQKPYCSMALNWCFNEPWPTAANNSIINWPNIPKPGFYAVRDACRPVMASARIKKLVWNEGETFESEIYMLNDKFSSLDPGKIIVKIVSGTNENVVLNWEYGTAGPNINLAGPTIRYILPHWKSDRFKLLLESEEHPEYNSEYLLLYRPKAEKSRNTRVLNQ